MQGKLKAVKTPGKEEKEAIQVSNLKKVKEVDAFAVSPSPHSLLPTQLA